MGQDAQLAACNLSTALLSIQKTYQALYGLSKIARELFHAPGEALSELERARTAARCVSMKEVVQSKESR
jgi:hypothetical protein